MANAPKLNSMRILEQHKVPYEVLEYSADIRDAEEVAEAIGAPYFTVYKTLVVQAIDRPDITKPYLALIASEDQLDLKKMASVTGVKKVKLAPHKDAEALTGLKVGGISALALLQKQWQIYLDQSATENQHIIISAGQRGLQLRVPVIPLVSILRARLADLKSTDD
jgi:Cys-tRNA(Pro)/Cys-tRNA(Cys) deacylase